MSFRIKLLFLFIICTGISSCVLIQESRNKKKLADITYEPVYETNSEPVVFEDITEEQQPDITAISKSQPDQYKGEIWYHPNPWWRIRTSPFPVAKDSVPYRYFSPQYGYFQYMDPGSYQYDNSWDIWSAKNRFYGMKGLGGHAWQAFIKDNKAVFDKHPEYLAEVDGIRVGADKTTKLCVTNKNMQQLYVQYLKETFKKDPDRLIAPISPSDGGGFCTCANCRKLGNISNQVFYLANILGKGIQKDYPQKQLFHYAYHSYSEVPDFAVENNILVAVVPNGFQYIYYPEALLDVWAKHHKNISYREYLGIPQWTGDFPRISVPTILTRTDIARQQNGCEVIYMESGININATIVSTLLSALWLNPGLTWEKVFEKFLDDCFKDSKEPVRKMFTRWHNYTIADYSEHIYALHDLQEASQLAKDAAEIERLRDLKAYVHLMALATEWNFNLKDTTILKTYFDYLYNSSNRNIVNIAALPRVYDKSLKVFPQLYEKYKFTKARKSWVRYITAKEIDKNFQNDLKKYGAKSVSYRQSSPLNTQAYSFEDKNFMDQISIDFSNNTSCLVISKQKQLTISVNAYTANADSPLVISVISPDGKFIVTRSLDKNASWTVDLPAPGTYTVSFNRIARVNATFKGKVIAAVNKAAVNDKKYSYYNIDQNDRWEQVTKERQIEGSTPLYFILKKNP